MSTSSWRDCVIWLKDIGFLPRKHRILRSDTVLSDLVDLLQDGSVLCYVLHFIDPSSIDIKSVHNHSSGSEISSVHNAELFLTTCQVSYNMSGSVIFDSSDLYERVRFERVLFTLSQLSLSERYFNARRANDSEPYTFEIARDESNAIYASVEDTPSDLHAEDEETIYDHFEDDIYEELIYSKYKDLEQILNEDANSKKVVKIDKKSMVINELVETEREYVRVLDVIINHYWRNLKPLITPEKLCKIFCNNSISTLLDYHRGLFEDLLGAVESRSPIAGAFITWQPKLANYAHYFSHLDEAMVVLEQCLKDNNFKLTLDHLKSTADIQQCRFNLSDVLRVPGQRILKYHLLVDTLKKCISPDDVHELSTTETAADKLKDLNAYMNESKRDAELKKKLLVLRETIQDPELSKDVEIYGKLLKDGELKVKFDSDGTVKKCHVFLFQRGLIFSSNRMEILSVARTNESKNKALFSEYDVDENHNRSNSILIKHKILNKQLLLTCKNSIFFTDWLDSIRDASLSSDPEKLCFNRHRFNLTSFSEVNKCFACDKLLKGAFSQGYRCDNCKFLAHRECLDILGTCTFTRRHSTGDALSPAQRPIQVVRPMQGTPSGRASSFYKVAVPLQRSGSLLITPGDVIEVFNDEADSGFGLRARKVKTGEIGYVPTDYIDMMSNKPDMNENPAPPAYEEPLRDYPWFSHVQSREISSKNCLLCPNLTFLVRKSESAMTYALMVHFNNVVRNIRIEMNKENRWYVAPELSFPSIPDLVDFYMRNSLQTNFPQLPTTLQIPFYEGVQMLKIQLKRPQQNCGPVGYVGLGQVIETHHAANGREMELASGELVKIISNKDGPDSLWRVEALTKCEVSNRDPDYLPIKGFVPGYKVKVF